MEIVGTNGIGKDRDDGVVIDDRALPDDEGAELNPRFASLGSLTPTPGPALASVVPAATSLPASQPLRLTREAPASAPDSISPRSVLPSGTVAPAAVNQRPISNNPFERKRPVWPLVVIAAVAGGGGVYFAVAPEAPLAKLPAPELALPALQPKAPERPKLSPGQARDSCVASYFDAAPSASASQNFAFVCQDGDFREIASRLQQLLRPLAAPVLDAGPPNAGEHADAGVRGADLDWYELPATAIIRKACCDGATPITLPETPGWCEQLQTVVRRIAEDSGKAGDLAPDARSFDKAVACLCANRGARGYVYDKAPSEANRAAFQQFLSRAAISEARR